MKREDETKNNHVACEAPDTFAATTSEGEDRCKASPNCEPASSCKADGPCEAQASNQEMPTSKTAATREAHEEDEAPGEATLPCPLCGIQVKAGALTCPRCKSRMDAHPPTPYALADAFDAWDALGDEETTARMTLPFHTGIHTGPLPTIDGPTAQVPIAAGQTEDLFRADPTAEIQTIVLEPAAWQQGPERPAPGPGIDEAPLAGNSIGSAIGAAAPPAQAQAPQADAPSAPEGVDQSSYVPLESKRRGRHVAGAVAASLLMVAFLAGGAHLAAQANTLNKIDDARVMADIRADETLAQGSAANDFVEAQAYAVDSVRITGKEAADGGVDVHATVGISNGFFSESQTVTLHYRHDDQAQDGGDGWTHDSMVESSEVRPTRGISHDDEQGIEGVAPALDSGGTACSIEVPYQADGTHWYASATGTRTLSYAFDGTAWSRTGVDETQTATTYQGLIGTYGQAQNAGGSWDWGFGSSRRGQTQLAEFAITWVDDATATFGGWFSWHAEYGLFDSKNAATGSFAGQIAEDGSLAVQSEGGAGSIEFEATDAGEGMLALQGAVYTESSSLFRDSEVQSSTFTATVSKQSDTAAAMPPAIDPSAQGGNEKEDANGAAQREQKSEDPNGPYENPAQDTPEGATEHDTGSSAEGAEGNAEEPMSFWDWWYSEDGSNSGSNWSGHDNSQDAGSQDTGSQGNNSQDRQSRDRWSLEELFDF